jgi:hypothetical protein
MRRRDFIAGIAGSAAAWPLAEQVPQGGRMRRIEQCTLFGRAASENIDVKLGCAFGGTP